MGNNACAQAKDSLNLKKKKRLYIYNIYNIYIAKGWLLTCYKTVSEECLKAKFNLQEAKNC